jgi:succinate dehydrogenase / fumarate reductase, cytochrome b subunit
MAHTVKNRPLSPHLQIYRPIPTMIASIMHRITGGALYFGTVLVAWWLVALASGPDHFATVNWFFGTWIGMLVLFGYTWVIIHHMLGGMRHLMWDLGRGFEKHFSTRLAKAQFVASPVITVVIWIIAYLVR